MYQSTLNTVDIGCQIVSVETVTHNGHLIFKCGDTKQKYIDYTLDEARADFRDILKQKGLI